MPSFTLWTRSFGDDISDGFANPHGPYEADSAADAVAQDVAGAPVGRAPRLDFEGAFPFKVVNDDTGEEVYGLLKTDETESEYVIEIVGDFAALEARQVEVSPEDEEAAFETAALSALAELLGVEPSELAPDSEVAPVA